MTNLVISNTVCRFKMAKLLVFFFYSWQFLSLCISFSNFSGCLSRENLKGQYTGKTSIGIFEYFHFSFYFESDIYRCTWLYCFQQFCYTEAVISMEMNKCNVLMQSTEFQESSTSLYALLLLFIWSNKSGILVLDIQYVQLNISNL